MIVLQSGVEIKVKIKIPHEIHMTTVSLLFSPVLSCSLPPHVELWTRHRTLDTLPVVPVIRAGTYINNNHIYNQEIQPPGFMAQNNSS